ncbi:MAG: hypothetical protein M1838_006021 [Thelocarpon superellum]|nr:MAG: hypothetical protein M1838_006021 [Thelocarpon superellum]
MPSPESPAVLVARFLATNGYHDTLAAFIAESGLPPDAGTASPGDLTIEKVLDEKKVFDLSLAFEKPAHDDGVSRGWTLPAPSKPVRVGALQVHANLLHVSVEAIDAFPHAAEENEGSDEYIIATTADRRLNVFSSAAPHFRLLRSDAALHDSSILSWAVIRRRWLVSASMSGQIILSDLLDGTVLEERRDHTKFVVKVAALEDRDETWLAAASWSGKVSLYRLRSSRSREGRNDSTADSGRLGPPVGTISLPTLPESVLFWNHRRQGVVEPSSSDPILVVSRRDSTFLYYYSLPRTTADASTTTTQELPLLGKQNLAPHSAQWISFSPSAMALCPTDALLIAVGTSSVPHMKLLILRQRLTPAAAASSFSVSAIATAPPAQVTQTQAQQAAQQLAEEEACAAAIRSHTSTLAPQTPFSTPQVCWRPDGSGIWVNGDDGVVRGVEARSGKVLVSLPAGGSGGGDGGHEPGSKIRTLWSGVLRGRECVLSGGFDRRLILWSVIGDGGDENTG